MSVDYKSADYKVYIDGQEVKGLVEVELECDLTGDYIYPDVGEIKLGDCYPFTLEDFNQTWSLEFVYDYWADEWGKFINENKHFRESKEAFDNANRANKRKALNKRNQNREDTGFNRNKFRNRFK